MSLSSSIKAQQRKENLAYFGIGKVHYQSNFSSMPVDETDILEAYSHFIYKMQACECVDKSRSPPQKIDATIITSIMEYFVSHGEENNTICLEV